MIDATVALGILAKCVRYDYALGYAPVLDTDEAEIERFKAFLQGVGRPAVQR